jgi:hypothetical protein
MRPAQGEACQGDSSGRALAGWWCLVALDEPARTVPKALGAAVLLSALTLLAPTPSADQAEMPA